MSKYLSLILISFYCFSNAQNHLDKILSSELIKVLIKSNAKLTNLNTRKTTILSEDLIAYIHSIPNFKNEVYILGSDSSPLYKTHNRNIVRIDRINKLYPDPKKYTEYNKQNVWNKKNPLAIPKYSFGLGLDTSVLFSQRLADFIPDQLADTGFSTQLNLKLFYQLSTLWSVEGRIFLLNESFDSGVDSRHQNNAFGVGISLTRFLNKSWKLNASLDQALFTDYDFSNTNLIEPESGITFAKFGFERIWRHQDNQISLGPHFFQSLRSNFNIPGVGLSLNYRWL